MPNLKQETEDVLRREQSFNGQTSGRVFEYVFRFPQVWGVEKRGKKGFGYRIKNACCYPANYIHAVG